jgi:hypothetical protein
MSDSDGKLRAPTWDGTGDKSGQCLLKTKTLAVYYGYGDTLEQTTMATAPTKSEYDAFTVGTTVAAKVAKIKLYEDNIKMAAIIILGQTSDHGLAMMESTISTDQPHGLVYKFIENVKVKYKPEDASAVIEMDNDLEKLKMKGTANDFYNAVITI